jgi:hypothetical protein
MLNSKSWGLFMQLVEVSGIDHAVSISWSQGYEDLPMLLWLGRKTGRFLDIGEHHPSRFLVIRHLSRRGWNVVNVKSNSNLIPEFVSVQK